MDGSAATIRGTLVDGENRPVAKRQRSEDYRVNAIGTVDTMNGDVSDLRLRLGARRREIMVGREQLRAPDQMGPTPRRRTIRR